MVLLRSRRFARFALLLTLTLPAGAGLGLGACSSDEFSSMDAGVEASADTAAALDGSVDASTPFCAAQPNDTVLCDDFDVERDSATGFRPDYKLEVNGGSVNRTTDAFSGFAFASVLPGSTKVGAAVLTFDPNAGKASHLTFSAMLKVEPGCAANNGVAVVAFVGHLGPTPASVVVSISTVGDATVDSTYMAYGLADGGTFTSFPAFGREIVFGTWMKYEIDVTFGAPHDGGKGTDILVRRDGTPSTNFSVNDYPAEMTFPHASFGAIAAPSTTACTLHYDNVVWRITP